MDDSFQPTIDMLLNVSIFIWFGAICPWYSFDHNNVIPIYRLIPLGILVLLLRRLPIIFALHTQIHQIEEKRQALFVGFFGPIGVSAIFYLYVSLEFLEGVQVNGETREDAAFLMEVMSVVIWFLVICSVVSPQPPFLFTPKIQLIMQIVHGLSIPMGKLGFFLPRTLSTALSFNRSPTDLDEPQPPVRINDAEDSGTDAEARLRRRGQGSNSLSSRVVRAGRGVISSGTSSSNVSRSTSMAPLPTDGVATAARGDEEARDWTPGMEMQGVLPGRTIKFRDEGVKNDGPGKTVDGQ
jgi:hypothetical protein